MRIKRAAKYGFCSGVRVADIKVKRFAKAGGRGAILGQVVHNERVVEEMARLGVSTMKAMDEIEHGVIVFSAHGVPPSYHGEAKRRGLEVLDTTCRFVYDIHNESQAALATGEAAAAAYERSDVTAVPACGVIVEAALAFVLARAVLDKFGGDRVGDTLEALEAYRRRLGKVGPQRFVAP